MRKLICTPIHGLSNRMFFNSYQQAFALLSARKFYLNWQSDIHCESSFSSLFENNFVIPKEEDLLSAETHDFSWIIDAAEKGDLFDYSCYVNYYSYTNTLNIKSAWKGSQSKVGLFRLRLFNRVYRNLIQRLAHYYLRKLKPTPLLQGMIDSFPIEHTLGVHIRRADFERPDIDFPHYRDIFEEQKLQSFIALINRELERSNVRSIFLSTNSPTVETTLSEIYGSQLLTREKSSYKRDATGVKDALIDLYLLSKTEALIGTQGSTFSECAAKLGGLSLLTPGTQSTP